MIEILPAMPIATQSKPDAITAVVALAMVEAGRREEARVLIDERGGNDFRDMPDDAAVPVGQCAWSEAAAMCGHERACQIFHDRMVGVADLHQVTGGWYLGATARYLGLLSDRLGRQDEADDWFAKAEKEHEIMRTPPWLARGRLDWAESHLRRGDLERAHDLARRALDTIGELELNVSRARAERILAE